jgi:mRNA deadenylase 3'-5' endonuclease subunit Ccr4
MAKILLAAAGPVVVTAASAAAFWLYNACKDSSSSSSNQAQAGDILPPTASLATTAADELSVVSWNVLADSFAPKLDYVQPEQLEWSVHRWPLIKQSLLTWRADLVMLQEVDVVW